MIGKLRYAENLLVGAIEIAKSAGGFGPYCSQGARQNSNCRIVAILAIDGPLVVEEGEIVKCEPIYD